MALKRETDKQSPVSPQEWLSCGEMILALADPANAPSKDLWHAVSADDRATAVRAIAESEGVWRAVQGWLKWSRLVASMVSKRPLVLSSEDESELCEHLIGHLSLMLVKKPEIIRVEGEPRKPYARSWFSESGASPDGLAQMWRAAVSPPGRRRAASPWAIPSPVAATGEPDRRDAMMTDPSWLQGWTLDALSREWNCQQIGKDIVVVTKRHAAIERFQVSFVRSLDGFVRASLKDAAGFRAWFKSEMLDDEVEGGFSCYWSFWASRKWVRDAAHLAMPLAVSAIPTQIRLDLKDYLKRLAKTNDDHPSQSSRPKIESVDSADLEALIEERIR